MPRPVELVHRDEAEAEAGERPPRRAGLIPRLAAGAALVGALATWGALVEQVPGLPLWWDVALAGFVLIPATFVVAWLALPLRTWDGTAAAGIALVTLALACALADLDVLGNAAKLLAVVLLALVFVNVFERPWWLGLVALAIPLVDALSVWRGPTRHIVTERPGVFDLLSISFPVPDGSFQLGLPDVLFFTLFLGAASRWGMRVPLSWVLMTASFGGTMALAIWLDPFGLGGLPALPLLCVAFLLANGDRLLRSVRPERPQATVVHLRAVPPEDEAEPEPEPGPERVAGVAADADGWVAAGVEDGRIAWSERRDTLAAALEAAGAADVVAVESPLAESSLQARADRLYLGPDARRVYLDFLRRLAAAGDDAEAEALCRELGWEGMRGESLDLRRRALELAAHRGDPRVVEVEPAAAGASRSALDRALAATESARAR